jgi:hypothetical protein
MSYWVALGEHGTYYSKSSFVEAFRFKCRNPSFGLPTKANVCKGAGQEGVRECENEDSHSQVNSHFGSWSLGGLPNFHRAITKVKPPRIEEFFISSKRYWSVDV